MSFRKVFLTIVFFAIIIHVSLKIKNHYYSKDTDIKVEKKVTRTSDHLPAEAPEPAKADDGWKETVGKNADYEWVTPVENDRPTKDLNIEPHAYTTHYEIVKTCIQQFKTKDGTIIASFKADVSNRKNYLENPTGSGKFEIKPWPTSEHTKAWQQAEWVCFRPLNNEPLDVVVGRK